ncbi:MAG: hypothetical protein QOF62_3350 [Pyrinomonadaceae bacterium]|nr:hypothetical protein [Pyrinomonadaceae bacterium]
MKQVFGSCCALALLLLVCGALSPASAQSGSPTPDPFVTQLTSSPAGNVFNPFGSFAGDISANGRFVVFESNGDVATQNRNNADGNREIFLVDYAQRRIFQITNTTNVPIASASPSPSPSASPTATPAPTPADPALIKYEISSNRPVLSFEPALVGGPPGSRSYTIVFSSNAPTLPSFAGADLAGFVGTTSAPATEGNQELWIYRFTVPEVSNLSSGDEVPSLDLSSIGTFTRVTDTVCSRPTGLRPAITPADVIDDNREATISDDGAIIAFISTRNLVGTGNTDSNPELFFRNTAAPSGAFIQGTNTADAVNGVKIISRFQQNPSLSASGNKVAFISTADLASPKINGDGNTEIYIADVTASGLDHVTQVTRTQSETSGPFTGSSVNLFSPGRRLSRDGALLAFESRAADPKGDSSATNLASLATFVYNVAGDTFTQVGLRPCLGQPDVGCTDIRHFPTFTDYTGNVPGALVFASGLNFKTDGSFPAAADDATGLNPTRQPQIFITDLPVSSTSTFKRLTNNPVGSLTSDTPIRPIPSARRNRMTFSLTSAELGGGNADLSTEVYYLLSPTVTSEAPDALTYFTAGSAFEVPASPAPSPSPTATPTPAPGTAGAGLATGEFSLIRSAGTLAPGTKQAVGGSEIDRNPIYPVELNGVSVSINGAAAPLYFVSATEIQFVVPIGIQLGIATIVVNNNGKVFRGFVPIVISQPDIYTVPRGPGGRAVVCNVTTVVAGCIMEPFNVTTADSTGAQVPTLLEIHATGMRGELPSEVTVTIGTTVITPTNVINNTKFFGEDLITVALPASLAGAGDVPVIVTVTKTGGPFQSRAAATAPRIKIN